MDFLESLNQVLMEDKHPEFVASIEVYPANELPIVNYGYEPLEAGERREIANQFSDIYSKQQLDKVLQHVDLTTGPEAEGSNLSPIVRGQLAKIRIPAEISQRWERELVQLHAQKREVANRNIKLGIAELKKQDEPDLQRKIEQLRGKELGQAREEALKDGWYRPVTREEIEAIAASNRRSVAQLADIISWTTDTAKLNVDPQLAQTSYDPHEFGITRFLPDYLIRHKVNPENAEERSSFVRMVLSDPKAFQRMAAQLSKRLYDFHMEHPNPNELLKKVLTDVLDYEAPEQAPIAGSVRDLYGQVNIGTPQGITLKTLLDTLIGWGEVELTDPSERVVDAAVDLPEDGEGSTYQGLIQIIQQALVNAGFQQDPFTLLDYTLRQIKEQPKSRRSGHVDPSVLELVKSYTKPAFRSLTDLPRAEDDDRPRPIELANHYAREKEQNDARGLPTKFPFSWLVITGSERAGQRGVRAEKMIKGQWVGECPTCRGTKAIKIPDGQWVACEDCGADGTDIAWYWDDNDGYEAHPAYSTQKHQQLTPFERIFQGIWIVLQKGELMPEAYDGVKREAGKLALHNGIPIPEKRETYTRGASNVESYTVTIKLNRTLGHNQKKVQTRFQEKIAPAFQAVLDKLGFQTRLEPMKDVESGFAPKRLNVFGYVIEPGWQELIGGRQSIEGPEQAPGQLRQYQEWTPQDRLNQATRIYEIAKIMDMRGFHEPHLWLALGMPENARLEQIPPEERNLSFTQHLGLALKNIQEMEAKAGESSRKTRQIDSDVVFFKVRDPSTGQVRQQAMRRKVKPDEKEETDGTPDSPIVKLLKDWIEQGDDKFNRKTLPANIKGYLRAKASLDAIQAAHIFGVPPEWNEIQSSEGDGKTRKRAKSRALSRREDLYRRAERLNQIWAELPEPYRSKMPGYAVMMGLGFQWDIPDAIATDIAERIRMARENEIDPYQETYTSPGGQEVQVIGPSDQRTVERMKLRGSQMTDREMMPLSCLKLALTDVMDVISDAKSVSDAGPLGLEADQIDELYRYASEIQAVIDHTSFKLLDPALKRRMRRERERMKKWEEVDRPQEIEVERSDEIRRIMAMKLWGHLETGEISDDEYYSDPTCLEVDIVQQIRQFIIGQLAVGDVESGISTEYFWQPDNVVKSLAQVAPALQRWLEREVGGSGQINLTNLVVPGTGLSVAVLRTILKKFQALNAEDESGLREKLLVQAFQHDKEKLSPLIQRGRKPQKRGEWFRQEEN